MKLCRLPGLATLLVLLSSCRSMKNDFGLEKWGAVDIPREAERTRGHRQPITALKMNRLLACDWTGNGSDRPANPTNLICNSSL
jgi:hypothetical protein